MRIEQLILRAYGRCCDVAIDIGDGVTVVLGANEAGKSTSLDALSDFLWGIPKNSSRASDFARPQLRIDAVLALDGSCRTAVRKSTGLFTEDLATEFPAVWNPANRLSAPWWRTRLGINHADLRRGGKDVCAGSGDIADIIFAAREGRSAGEVFKEIADQADKLFKPDGRAKKVQLRLAVEEYKRAVADRDGRLTRAGEVMAQRDMVQKWEDKRRHLRDDATATSQELKRQEENKRVIVHVLQLHRATAQLDVLDQEGDRLTPAALDEYGQAVDACRTSEGRISKLDSGIEAKTRIVEELPIDERLLDDRETFGRLQPEVKARIEDLSRVGEESGTAVEEAADRLRQLLATIGIDVVNDLDAALAEAKIRDDHAATLNELAASLEDLEDKRREARDAHDDALTELLAKGITVEINGAAAPEDDVINTLRKQLTEARNDEEKAKAQLANAAAGVQMLQAGAADPHAEATLTHTAVADSRNARDAQWHTIRRSWVSGDLPEPADRVDLAADFDTALAGSDRVSDAEAAERSRVAALDARTAMQVEGLDAARRKEQEAAAFLETESEDLRRAEAEWVALWTDLGIASAPDVDSSSLVAGLLVAVHVAQSRERSAAEQIAGLAESWCTAAELAGLPATTTSAAWRTRAEVLGKIQDLDVQRTKDSKRAAQARVRWEDFAAEAADLLRRHELIAPDQSVTPAIVEQGFGQLGRQLDAAGEAATKRGTYLEQIEEMRAEREEARQYQQDAVGAVQRLVESHGVDTEDDLARLAERAERATDPLREQQEATTAIKNGLGPGADLNDVIERLAGHDESTVDQAVEDAQVRDQEARNAAEHALSEYRLAREHLNELERAAGAADAEVAVVTQQAEVARLAESWAILALQRKLLEDVLEGLGAGDTRPLLDHAGQLLEELTEGRWVALRAEDDGTARTLRVIRADNTPCDTSQLSEGTADQVFFALRLAAVAELHNERAEAGEEALPLVLDDVLMAFDEARVHSALKILAGLAPGLQIVVFTHHQHVADAAVDVGGITVSRLPEAAMITGALDSELVRAQG